MAVDWSKMVDNETKTSTHTQTYIYKQVQNYEGQSSSIGKIQMAITMTRCWWLSVWIRRYWRCQTCDFQSFYNWSVWLKCRWYQFLMYYRTGQCITLRPTNQQHQRSYWTLNSEWKLNTIARASQVKIK